MNRFLLAGLVCLLAILTIGDTVYTSVNGTTSTASITSGGSVTNNNVTAQTGAATVCTYTTPAIGTYRVGGYIAVTAILTDVVQLRCTFTDQNNNSVTATFFPQGLTSANIATTGFFSMPPQDIRVKSATLITVALVLTTGTGSITYDCGGSITLVQ